jgi:hypothetical protein
MATDVSQTEPFDRVLTSDANVSDQARTLDAASTVAGAGLLVTTSDKGEGARVTVECPA